MAFLKELHWRILIALVLGLVFGIAAASWGWGNFVGAWIQPWGTIFINLLKLIAIPLVLTSLVVGVTSLSDTSKLTRLGGKTIGLYLGTTAVAITIGLVMANIAKPGKWISPDMRESLTSAYQETAAVRTEAAAEAKSRGPLQPIVDMVPDNFFYSASSNRNMLQLVFVSILIGVALVRIPKEESQTVIQLFSGLNHTVIEVVRFIMQMAPIGVFALMAGTITEFAGDDPSQVIGLLKALSGYALIVALALGLHILIVYTSLVKFCTRYSLKKFFGAIGPAQLFAFSTSSSGATLPVTMQRCREGLDIPEETTSFVLPLGATINMDGTALYQGVAALFITQALGMDLTFGGQITILMTALLASVGTAAVPGAGVVMLIVILEAIGAPAESVALILAVDRPLDMLRTATNVTGDAAVCATIATSEASK